jgi:lipoprotein signal peptidase
MNSFMNYSTHSIWPIVLTILNIPPWSCNKQNYIVLLGLILGQQLGNDVDTYFRTLVEDLKVLWYNHGVEVWDEHKHEYFQLQAIFLLLLVIL